MGRPWGLPAVTAVLALLFFTAGLAAVYLPAELDDPAHYDGDGNDAGSIRKPAPPWPTVVGVDFSEPLAPALLVQRAPLDPPTDLPGDPAPVRLVSRAPPA